MLGAVYVAESAVELPPVDCVVVTLRTPQEDPLQPVPLSDQASTVLGLELGGGVSVATMVALVAAGMLDGAESCSEKLLVMVIVTEICFDGSATLCAVSVTLAGEGRIPGAIKLPLESTVPHAPGHAAPDKLQRTVVSGWPLLVTLTWKRCMAPSSTLAGLGVRDSVMSLVTVTLAVADFVASAWLVAVICTVGGAGKSAGAV